MHDYACIKMKNMHNVTFPLVLHGTIAKSRIDENTLKKKSYMRPPHIFSSSSESKIRSINFHDYMNKPMSNSGSVSFCISKCAIFLTQTKHE